MSDQDKPANTNAAGTTKIRGKREQIVQAAVKVFLEKGYAATSMNAVAEEAGVIKATIYSHFKDKQALFVGIIEEMTVKKLTIDLSNPEPILKLSPEEFVDVLTQKFTGVLKDPQYQAFFRLLVGESERFPELPELYVRTVIIRGMGLATKYFEAHQELNIKDPMAMAHICAGSFISLMTWQHILGGKNIMPLEYSRVADQLKSLIVQTRAESQDSNS